MAVGDQRQRRKMPSFSSSLLDAIYHSIDEQPNIPQRRNVDDEIESLRRAIMVEKWMENYTHTATATATARHLPSNSSSSTDSIFTSSETDSSSTPKPRTKSKIYGGDLKKVKEPVSPAARIASFLNSIFSPRNNLKKDHPAVRKSRSMKDTAAAATAATSRSCLTSSKNVNINKSKSKSKSKRCVRFCPLVDQDSSLVYKKNIERDFDDKSCASSDLFELENIIGPYDQELPVYGTTDLKINRAIATGFKMY